MTTPRPGPRSGEDTCDPIGDAPAVLAGRRGACPGADLAAITLIAGLTGQAERFVPELVASARLNGHTWDQIAATLATSPDQARLRYGPESPIADTRRPYDLEPQPANPLHAPSRGRPRTWPASMPPGGRPRHSPAAAPPAAAEARRPRRSARSEAKTNDLQVRRGGGHTRPRGRPRWDPRTRASEAPTSTNPRTTA
jgi:hypothetical protein